MIQLAVAACLGAWAYVPADLDSDVAFKLSLGADSQFEMEFSDFGRSRGRWNRHRDNSFDLVEGSEKVATIKDCRDGSATVLINDRELSVTTYDAATYPTIIEDTTAIDAEVEAENATRRWKPVRSGQWLIQVNSTSVGQGTPSCLMRGADLVVGARRHGQYLIVTAVARSQSAMSRLRENTTASTPMTAIFDGDVRYIDDTARRTGREMALSGFSPFLDFIEAGTTVTVRSSTDSSGPISLAGSAAGGAILRRCADHVVDEPDLYQPG